MDIKLNDTVRIGYTFYNINQKKINFLTGETELELITSINTVNFLLINDEDKLIIDDAENILEI
jgi:hypothetical protein